jgi:CRP-like cAMP-binding protein
MSALPQAMNSAVAFSACRDVERRAIFKAMRPQKVKAGDAVFRQGETGDAMHLIVEGILWVRSEQENGRTFDIAKLNPGEVFGEMSCLDPAPRSASVIAETDALIYVLNRATLELLMQRAVGAAIAFMDGLSGVLTTRLRETDDRLKAATLGESNAQPSAVVDASCIPEPSKGTPYKRSLNLRKIESLTKFSDEELKVLARVAPPMVFKDGEYLCREGDQGDALYIIGGGKVEVVKIIGNEPKHLADLQTGAFVGQLALLDDVPRSASIRAKGDAGVLTVARVDFRRLLDAHDTLALRLLESVTVAGVRQIRMANDHITRLLAQRKEQESTEAKREEAASSRPATVDDKLDAILKSNLPLPPKPRPKKLPSRHLTARKKRGEPLWRKITEAQADRITDDEKALAESRGEEWHEGYGRESEGDDMKSGTYLATALNEWGLSLEDLDNVKVATPVGQVRDKERQKRLS